MATIIEVQPIETEIVIQEKVVSTEFKIVGIRESLQDRYVQAEVELGPFTADQNGRTSGTSLRGVTVWSGDAYDQIRDTWRNEDLIAAVKSILEYVPPVVEETVQPSALEEKLQEQIELVAPETPVTEEPQEETPTE